MSKHLELWLEKFNLLKEYKAENNNQEPINGEVYKNINLGNWVASQRYIYNYGTKQSDGTLFYRGYRLNQLQINKLESINFNWIISESRFNKKIIKSDNDFQRFKRIMNSKVNRLTDEKNYVFQSKKDVELLNSKLIDSIHISGEKKGQDWNYKFSLLVMYLRENGGNYPKTSEVYKKS